MHEARTIGLDPDRLFPVEPRVRDLARALHGEVRGLPILSAHGHTDPRWYAENAAFPDPARPFVAPDRYVFRMLCSQGVPLTDLGVPLGPVQFVAAAVGKISIWEAMRSIWPFYGAGVALLLLVTYHSRAFPLAAIGVPLMLRSYTPVKAGHGVTRRGLAENPEMMVVEFAFAPGGEGKPHSHPHVQSTFVQSGRYAFVVGAERFEVGPATPSWSLGRRACLPGARARRSGRHLHPPPRRFSLTAPQHSSNGAMTDGDRRA